MPLYTWHFELSPSPNTYHVYDYIHCLNTLIMAAVQGTNFSDPIRSYDIHVYFFQTSERQVRLAKELQAEIKEKFPRLKVYKWWKDPIGPHPIGNFEVNLRNPEEFLLLVPWIQLNRRGFSVLVHPNTGNPLKDHTEHAAWIGEKQILNIGVLKEEDDGYGYFS